MFSMGLFSFLGFSPGGTLFNVFVTELEKYVQYAAIIALLVLVWFLRDSIITPLRAMWRGYRVCGGIGIIAMLVGFMSGYTLISHLQSGLILLGIAFLLWFVAIVTQR
jgi:hypothetical protein